MSYTKPDFKKIFILNEKTTSKKRIEDRKAAKDSKEKSTQATKTSLRVSKSKNVKTIEDQQNISASELANLCDVDRSTIRSLENGKVDVMTYKLLKKVADTLGCSVDKLADANRSGSLKESATEYTGMYKSSSRPDAEVHGRSVGSKNKEISLDKDPANNKQEYESEDKTLTAKAIRKKLSTMKTNNVKDAREALDIPRTVFADVCGINFQMVRVIERPSSVENMRYGILRKIADAFKCSVDELVDDNT